MTDRNKPDDLKGLLEAASAQTLPSYAERSAMFMDLAFATSTEAIATGLGAVGNMPLRTYVYARNPSRTPGGPAKLADQVAACAEAYNLDIRGVFCDGCGPARALVELPELMRLLIHCRNGQVDAIVVEQLGRLIRSGMAVVVLEWWERLNITLFDLSLGGPVELKEAYYHTAITGRPRRARSTARRR